MKKLLSLMIVVLLGFTTFAQEIERPSSSSYFTFGRDPVKSRNYSYWDYDGVAADLLVPTTSDTIHLRYHVRKHVPYTAKVISKFSPIAGADTIVYINLLGRNSTDESWTSIFTDSSAVVTTDNVKKTVNTATSPTYVSTFEMDTTALWPNPPVEPVTIAAVDSVLYSGTISFVETSTLLEYEYLLVEYILAGDDVTGTGVELKRSELKLFEH